MPLADLSWQQGQDNMGGLVGDLFFCPSEDIDTASLPTLDADGITLTGDFVCKSTKRFYRIYHTKGTGKIDSNVVGERDGRAIENLCEFFHPGNTPEAEIFKRRIKNTPIVLIGKDSDGKFRAMGVVALGSEGSEVVSLEMPAYLESMAGTTGAAVTDRRGSTFGVKSEAPHPPLFYNGTIPLTPAT